ncbi:3TM-type holin [Rhodoligotrophos defluvii]|uniref:3TM-type holin n=1 Tax=Rhodoligotrophos defluvii TaxID=2561934 RepID=UPI0010C93ABD|nr:3TM-type holin [Rhodoligotrophos defluvii]
MIGISTILGWLTGDLLGQLIQPVKDVILKFQDRKITEAELDAEIRKALLSTFAEVAKTQGDVIIAEAKGESWLQRNWRPMVGCSLAFVPLFYGVITPVAVDWLGMPPVRVGDPLLKDIVDLVALCLGGYIAGRSLEKMVGTITSRKK